MDAGGLVGALLPVFFVLRLGFIAGPFTVLTGMLLGADINFRLRLSLDQVLACSHLHRGLASLRNEPRRLATLRRASMRPLSALNRHGGVSVKPFCQSRRHFFTLCDGDSTDHRRAPFLGPSQPSAGALRKWYLTCGKLYLLIRPVEVLN